MAVETPVVALINTLLDQERQRRKLSSDVELARVLSVSSKTISMWRNGRSLPKATTVMLQLVLAARQGR